MKLYIHPSSPNSRAVVVAARLLGQPLDLEQVELSPGGQRPADYLAINPNGYVPVLVDGDFHLWETDAIMQYLAGVAAPSSLWPEDLRQRADVTRWQFWNKCHWTPTLQTFVFENVFKGVYGLGTPDDDKLEAAAAKFEKFGTVLSVAVSSNPFAAGKHLTLADLSLASYLIHAERAGIPIARFPAISSWAAKVLSDEGWSCDLEMGRQFARA